MVLTLFYSKATGNITTYCLAEEPQDMSMFGEAQVDYEIIWDCIHINYTEALSHLIDNQSMFRVDLETKRVVYKDILDGVY